MKTCFMLFLSAACLFLAGCSDGKKAPADSAASSGNPLTAPADYVGAIGQAQKSAQKTLSTVGIDQALKAFYATEGRFPTELNELVTKGVLTQIPSAPRGMKYQYDATAGTIKVVPE